MAFLPLWLPFSILVSAVLVCALPESLSVAGWRNNNLSSTVVQAIYSPVHQYIVAYRRFTLWDMVKVTTLCSVVSGVWFLSERLRQKDGLASKRSSRQVADGMSKAASVNDQDESEETGERAFLCVF